MLSASTTGSNTARDTPWPNFALLRLALGFPGGSEAHVNGSHRVDWRHSGAWRLSAYWKRTTSWRNELYDYSQENNVARKLRRDAGEEQPSHAVSCTVGLSAGCGTGVLGAEIKNAVRTSRRR